MGAGAQALFALQIAEPQAAQLQCGAGCGRSCTSVERVVPGVPGAGVFVPGAYRGLLSSMMTTGYVRFSELSPVSPVKNGHTPKQGAAVPCCGSFLDLPDAGNSSRTDSLFRGAPKGLK